MSDCGSDIEDFFDAELFVDKSYVLKTLHVADDVDVNIFALHNAATTDHDLTGQVVWPAAALLALYLTRNRELLHSSAVLELGAGAGLVGLAVAKLVENPAKVVLTDHNSRVLELLERNIEANFATSADKPHSDQLCWGEDVTDFVSRRGTFDVILGADIVFWLTAVPLLFDTVKAFLTLKKSAQFVLSYIHRSNHATSLMYAEAASHGLHCTALDLALDSVYVELLARYRLAPSAASILTFTLNTDT